MALPCFCRGWQSPLCLLQRHLDRVANLTQTGPQTRPSWRFRRSEALLHVMQLAIQQVDLMMEFFKARWRRVSDRVLLLDTPDTLDSAAKICQRDTQRCRIHGSARSSVSGSKVNSGDCTATRRSRCRMRRCFGAPPSAQAAEYDNKRQKMRLGWQARSMWLRRRWTWVPLALH